MKCKRSDTYTTPLVMLGLFGACAPGAHADTFVVYGASGSVGSVIVEEAMSRGHEVVGVSRNPESLRMENTLFSAVPGDITDPESIVATVRGADAVIIAVGGVGPGNTPEEAVGPPY